MAGRSQHLEQIMENQTRFNLNAAIENWRDELAAQPNLASDDRRELEAHLRDAVMELRQRGLNEEESFWLARRRVGQPQQLGEEFVKVDPAKVWRERVFWMLLAIFLSGTLGNLANSIVLALVPVNSNSTAGAAETQLALLLLASLIPIVIAVSLAKGKLVALFSKLTLLVDNRRRLATAAIICIALSSLIKIAAYASFYSRMHVHSAHVLLPGLVSAIYPLIIALLLVWLMPPQNRKTPRRA